MIRPADNRGFTLIELIVYIGIVSMMLVSITYLLIDLLVGQARSEAAAEVNYNLRLVTNRLERDIRSAQDFSLTVDDLTLALPGDDITYTFLPMSGELTRQVGSQSPAVIHTNQVAVTGDFTDWSFLGRTKSVGINLTVAYRNPSGLTELQASSTVQFAVELRGRR